jgi:nitrate reductase NapAB chaperone NapD
MCSLVLDALPKEISQVKTILENLVEIRAREPKAKFV